ncbi:hypothetical protein WR25_21514 [Diploscapter pachys]|uniref:Uncharacterized protein n=1 Tax=Diploscapter pachys TaxID=2018661 RepID=A0A2A2K388_9BILA|nr:hypothetical protein WR25_21514 [Diploscapter pachys]
MPCSSNRALSGTSTGGCAVPPAAAFRLKTKASTVAIATIGTRASPATSRIASAVAPRPLATTTGTWSRPRS